MRADRKLLDTDGKNRAVRSFLIQYGAPSLTVGAMRQHMARSGWGDAFCPAFVANGHPDRHLTEAGAQLWMRHLFDLEKK